MIYIVFSEPEVFFGPASLGKRAELGRGMKHAYCLFSSYSDLLRDNGDGERRLKTNHHRNGNGELRLKTNHHGNPQIAKINFDFCKLVLAALYIYIVLCAFNILHGTKKKSMK
jgi:hypothetical protein